MLPSEITELEGIPIPVQLYFSGKVFNIEDTIQQLAKHVSTGQGHDSDDSDDSDGDGGGNRHLPLQLVQDRPGPQQVAIETSDKEYEVHELLNGDADETAEPIIPSIVEWFRSKLRDLKTSKKRKKSDPIVAHKHTIEDFTKKILEEMRPNGCYVNKQAQLECHLRFLDAYRNDLLPKGNYFYYLNHHEGLIKTSLQLLQEKKFEEFNNLKIPANLSNISCGKCVLADRGFHYDTMRYPNFNPHLTPHMRNANGQAFTKII